MNSKRTLVGLAAGAASMVITVPAHAAPATVAAESTVTIYHGNDEGVIFFDFDGANNGCVGGGITGDGWKMSRARLCENREGCTSWRQYP